ncbi:MAG: DUF993 family protein [Acidobacteriota bacterium]|nr:DUF993 family protein [Acidobacteriota bacterium]
MSKATEVSGQLAAASLPRLCYAALHVVVRDGYAQAGHSMKRPGSAREIEHWIDWKATAGLRRWVDSLGFGVAEAMDTAQRFEIGWPSARRLIELCASLELRNGFVAGAGSDQFDAIGSNTQLIDAVAEQAEFIAESGGVPVLLPMPRLTATGASEREYVNVYGAIIDQLEGPLFLHWLGEMFHPAMRGYFPGNSLERVLARHADKVRGVKLSLLDEEYEVLLRRRIGMRGQIVLTGDDYHFARLLEGQPAARGSRLGGTFELKGRTVALGDFSHALLGAFDAVAEPAAAALRALGDGDVERYRELMGPAEELARFIFQPPTRHYKAGLAYHAWLRGLQDNPMLVNREDLARDEAYYRGVATLARRAGTLGDD